MKIIYNNMTKKTQIEEIIASELTAEEIRNQRIIEIKEELKELDKIINRATEDIYVSIKIVPYIKTEDVIQKKEKLRAELKDLNEK